MNGPSFVESSAVEAVSLDVPRATASDTGIHIRTDLIIARKNLIWSMPRVKLVLGVECLLVSEISSCELSV